MASQQYAEQAGGREKNMERYVAGEYMGSITALNDRNLLSIFTKKEYNNCISLFRELQHRVKNENYGVTPAGKKCQYYHMFVCYYNTSLTYQAKNDNYRACQFMEKALHNYERLQGCITSRQENIGYLQEMVKILLQYCGLLSHCQEHQQAAILAEKSLDKLVECSRILQAVCYEQILISGQRETTCTSAERSGRGEMVNFKKMVLEEAEGMLAVLSKLPSPHRLISEERDSFQQIMGKIVAWKENGENNEVMLKRELRVGNNHSTRSLLGIQKSCTVTDYEIGSLMMLNWRNIGYAPSGDALKLLASDNLRHLAFLGSVSYFTVATETRFAHSDLSDLKSNSRIDLKYKRLHHDERLMKCKILHLKGLELAGKLLPANNCLFSHLAQSFCRNYKFVMDQIHEVSQINQSFTIKPLKKSTKANQNIQGQYQTNKYSVRNTVRTIVRREMDSLGRSSRSNSGKQEKKARPTSEIKGRLLMRSISMKKKNV